MKRKKSVLALKQTPPISVLEDTRTHIVLNNVVELMRNFGFEQVSLPTFTEGRIFRGSALLRHFGNDLVSLPGLEKEYVLSPTHLLSVPRLYLEGLKNSEPFVARWFYVSPVVQNGRAEVRHEFGIFILGEESNLAQAQLINIAAQALQYLGISELVTEISSMGCSSCQKDYQEALQSYLGESTTRLCANCTVNLSNNVMGLFNCRNDSCQAILGTAPQILDFLDDSCRGGLVETLETIDELEIPYILNPTLSGTIPHEKITFRVSAGDELLGQGGNFTQLISPYLEQETIPCLAFISILEQLSKHIPEEKRRIHAPIEVFMISLGIVGSRKALNLFRELTQSGIRVRDAILGSQGIKTQLKEAVASHAVVALIIGQKEAQEETVILRDMRSGMQEVFPIDRTVEEVKKRLGK